MKTTHLFANAVFALAMSAGSMLSSTAVAQDVSLAPPAFGPNNSYVPIDISTIDIDYVFDIDSRKATGVATVRFGQAEQGKPFFDIIPDATALTVNNEELSPRLIKTVQPKIRITSLRILDKVLPAGNDHEMKISFDISDKPKFSSGKVNVGFFVSDLADRAFFEKFGPTNFQFDQIKYTFNVSVKGANEDHRVFTNGKTTPAGFNAWQVEFPDYYNTSTLYFHLVPKSGVKVVEGEYRGKNKTIPIVVYSKSGRNLEKYLRQTISKLGSLEKRFGPTIHDTFTIYISGSGGMEYSGATITSARALNHELTHSWYARGVFPADGNSSWIDEAVASWQDAGYKRAKTGPTGSPVNLSAHYVFTRQTDRKAYSKGKDLMSQLDNKFSRKGGIIPMLASFYQANKEAVITTDMFQKHLEKESGESMSAIFNKYVYGKRLFADDSLAIDVEDTDGGLYPQSEQPEQASLGQQETGLSMHPRRFTEQELYDLQ